MIETLSCPEADGGDNQFNVWWLHPTDDDVAITREEMAVLLQVFEDPHEKLHWPNENKTRREVFMEILTKYGTQEQEAADPKHHTFKPNVHSSFLPLIINQGGSGGD